MGNSVGNRIRIFGDKMARDAVRTFIEPCIIDEESGEVDPMRLNEALPCDVWRWSTRIWLGEDITDQCLTLVLRTDNTAPLDAIRQLVKLFPRTFIVASADDYMACWKAMWTVRDGEEQVIYVDIDWGRGKHLSPKKPQAIGDPW